MKTRLRREISASFEAPAGAVKANGRRRLPRSAICAACREAELTDFTLWCNSGAIQSNSGLRWVLKLRRFPTHWLPAFKYPMRRCTRSRVKITDRQDG